MKYCEICKIVYVEEECPVCSNGELLSDEEFNELQEKLEEIDRHE